MIIEKTVVENNRYNVDLNDYVAEGELTVTITLSEYRDLIEKSVENKQRTETSSRNLLRISREKSMKAGSNSTRGRTTLRRGRTTLRRG